MQRKQNRNRRIATVSALAAAAGFLAGGASAVAGGTPENVILIIDPINPVSMRIGNHYKNARNIPDANVLYMRSIASNYSAFCNSNTVALLGSMDQRSLADHAHYVVVAPLDLFYVDAPGLVTDACSPVTRFSIGTAYGTAFIRSEVLSATTGVALPNQYFSLVDQAVAFDGSVSWFSGSISTAGSARRYLIGAMLGYTGTNGNTPEQIIAMIDRSVAADGTRPAGTFYYMNTTDPDRNVRQPGFPGAINPIVSRGGTAVQLNGSLPNGTSNALGIMTGVADLDFAAVAVSMLPGSFGDHLTSYAATFDIGAQTKVSAWINAGASGSAGTVEEPCNYNGKFPHPRFHLFYFEGLSLGEAYFRSMQYVPFQSLLYGDPLTRPFAYIPVVTVPGAPTGTVSGTISLTAQASGLAPGAAIAGFDLYVDGVKRATSAGGSFNVNTATLDDGVHDVRILARDNSPVKSVGRWVSTLTTSNYGRSVTLGVNTSSGNLATAYDFSVAAFGGAGVQQILLKHNGRIIAATQSASGTLRVYGHNLGAGIAKVQAEATYVGGRIARSAPVQVTVADSGGTVTGPSTAFSYDKAMYQRNAYIVELPASFPNSPTMVDSFLLTNPTQATVATMPAGPRGPYRIITPNANASGSETVTFLLTTPGGNTNTATIRLVYTAPIVCAADFDNNGAVEPADVATFINTWLLSIQQGTLAGDFDHNGLVQPADVASFVNAWFVALTVGCG